jgi:tRNA pseudouridine55 synthase
MPQSHPDLNGLLPVNKPAGVVSKDVSRWLVKRLGRLKLGHVGTLDPAASGVLPILLGRATRLQDYLLELPKTYEFDITFGTETDTLDLDGQVTRETPWEHVTEAALAEAIKAFIGDFEQTPPLYSAVKYKGKPLYDYARGKDQDAASAVPLDSLKRKVTVSRFELTAFRPGVGSFRLTCSKGTYVRSLVKDVAEKVGSCGTLTRLVRTRAAGVEISRSLDLEALESRLEDVSSLVVPVEGLDLGVLKWRAPRGPVAERLRGGQTVVLTPAEYLEGVDGGAGPNDRSTSDRSLPPGWAKPVLLLNEEGEAFGIGSVRRQESGRIVIVMKRGL